ncbi:hypothetical protein B0J17DRAFT_632763 [Rhizoctonia solani]|nr:hypothetical protein B0J17DRAFT_632763 [Rhizoctonia solani]
MTRVAIVTGAAQGIGRAIALQLARDGIDLAVNDIFSKRVDLEQLLNEIEQLGRRTALILGDVSNETEVKSMVQKTVDVLGSLDITILVQMVANAGVPQYHTPLLNATDEDFDRVMDINCKGTLYCYRAAAVQMIKQGRGGRITGASSMVGIHASRFSMAYCASKFAIRAITQTAALEWGQYNITVNAYAPGIIETSMISEATGGASSEQLADLFMSGACLKRPGQPEEVAALVGFLASENAAYITAATLHLLNWSK